MIFDDINLESELKKVEQKTDKQMDQVYSLLQQSASADSDIVNRLSQKNSKGELINDIKNLDSNRIYSLASIEKICVKYRLRFLDTSQFNAQYPYEAIHQIKAFERDNKCTIGQFKIIAPAGVFKLKDVNEDPLLFAQISQNKFYLLHKWGNDLKFHRPLIHFPLRSIYTFFVSVIIFAAVFSMLIPTNWLNVEAENVWMFRFWLTTHFTIAYFFFFLFIGSLTQANFSDSSWNSKNFNG